MSDREKETLERLCSNVSSLDEKDRNYILGVAEGMAIVKERESEKENTE